MLEYDPRGRLISLLEQKENARHPLARMKYDGIGNITQLEGPRGVVEVEYDAAGRPISVKMPDGKKKNWRWNTKDKLMADELLDREGRQLVAKHFKYDSAGRMTLSSANQKENYHYEYDALGRLQKIVDPLGIETDYEYNPWGKVVAVFNVADGERQIVERKHYNVHGLQDAQQDGRGNISRQEYDDFGRLLWRETPDNGVVMYRYNEFDSVTARVDESGVVTRFDYDQQARLSGIGGFSHPATTRYYYRKDGKPEKVVTPRQTVATDYGADGKLSERSIKFEQLGKSFEMGYRYDSQGRIVEKILPGGEKLVYAYQGESRQPHRLSLKGWLSDTPVIESVEWDERGRLKSLTKQAGVKTALEYDIRGRLQRIKSISDVYKYEYDQLSRLVGVASGDQKSRYSYDNLGRLSEAKIGKDEYRYAYDAAGNRTDLAHAAGKDVYRYAQNSNRLLQLNDVDYRYDSTGRLIERGDLRYEYNAGGRLSAVYRADRLQATFEYNSEGERISKTDHTRSPSVTTYFLYEKNRLVAEISEDGNVSTQYIYLANRPVGVIRDEQVYMIVTDWRQAPIDVVGPEGKVVWHAQYRPFGSAEINADPDKDGEKFALNLRLPGQYYDTETGIAYNLHRDYDPSIGRFLTSDPLGVSAGLNTYAYVESDPINRIDPTGLYGEDMHYYMTYFLATVAGLDQETVSVIAHGAQYIDDNPLTSPILGGARALRAYHFIMPRMDSPGNPLTSFLNPTAAQLDDLYRSAMAWDYMCPMNRQPANLLKAQLYGEYLHAYADTYAHRDNENNPYGIWSLEGGYGHLFDGEDPDKTYNFHYVREHPMHPEVFPPTYEYWEYQEVRTLEAERTMFFKLREDFRAEIERTRVATDPTATALNDADYQAETDRLWRQIAGDGNADVGEPGTPHYTAATGTSGILQDFNKTADEATKISKLNDWLNANGSTLSNNSTANIAHYSEGNARTNRSTYLEGFTDGDLDGVLLPSPVPETETETEVGFP
jgi:RHS repeat-associated protein